METFFVWKLSTNENQMVGYIYTGNCFCDRNFVSYSLPRPDKSFCWVNLCQDQFPTGILHDLMYPVSIGDNFYYGDHTPSRIQLPHPNKSLKFLNCENYTKQKHLPNSNDNTLHDRKTNEAFENVSNTTSTTHISKRTHLNPVRYRSNGNKMKKRCKIFQTNNLQEAPYMTIFLPETYVVPYKEFLNSSVLYIPTPYMNSNHTIENHPFCTVEFALIHYTNVKYLQGLDQNEYNSFLNNIQALKFTLYQPTIDQPTRFCIVNEEKFNQMILQKNLYSLDELNKFNPEMIIPNCDLQVFNNIDGTPEFLYGITNLPNVMLPGVCVSMWRCSKLIEDVSLEFTDTIEGCFGRGFGDRSCAPCLGVNMYFGHHYSKRVLDRPETKPGTRVYDHYGRQNDKNNESIPMCQKFVYAQAKRVREVASTMNKNYMLFVGFETCDRIIWTQGINNAGKTEKLSGHQNQSCLSFANKLHVDKCDIIKNDTSQNWFKWLEIMKQEKCRNETRRNTADYVIGKFKEVESMFGIGLPTTCGYTHIVSEDDYIVDINASFIQMIFAMPIRHKSLHHMYAWTFPHATALTVATTSKYKILVHNETDKGKRVNVAAWGNSGGFKHAEKRKL